MKFLQTILLLAIGLFASSSLYAAQAWKCTAEDGSISFLDKKPSEGCATVEVIDTHVGRGKPADYQAGMNEEDRKVQEERDKQIAERDEKAKQVCEGKKNNLDVLQKKSRVKVKGEDGQDKLLSQEEHQAMIDDIKQYLSEYCK